MSSAFASFFSKNVHSMSEQELDSLAYGIIQLDTEGTVLRYNKHEAGLSGLSQPKVVGKNFFKQVAPCTDIRNSMDVSGTGSLPENCIARSASTLRSRRTLAMWR
jgi:photoactive yellow protein